VPLTSVPELSLYAVPVMPVAIRLPALGVKPDDVER
jgi:hypothetical protein